MIRTPPSSTLFPSTTLFRSCAVANMSCALDGLLVGQGVRGSRAEDIIVGIVGHRHAAATQGYVGPIHFRLGNATSQLQLQSALRWIILVLQIQHLYVIDLDH